MKILVITFSKGVNPGTFIQALGVKTGLIKIFPDAQIDYLKFPDFKKNIMNRGKRDSLKTFVLQKGYAAYRLLKYRDIENKNFNYTRQVNILEYDKTCIDFIHSYDLVVIGSDTILEEAYGNNGEIALNWMPLGVKKIYFAASASPANFKVTSKLKKVASEAVYIGLRDDLTIKLFSDRLNIDKSRLFKQPDPSFFLDVKKFDLSNRNKCKLIKSKKHVLYNFNSNFPYRQELANKLRNLGYTVVSTAYNPYADICFDTIDALEWAGVFQYMDLIVTERFHDSVFALRNCKPVIAIDWDSKRFSENGNSKTLGILSDYRLSKLHVNLKTEAQLVEITGLVSNISEYFHGEEVELLNKRYIDYASRLLEKIKDKYILSNG